MSQDPTSSSSITVLMVLLVLLLWYVFHSVAVRPSMQQQTTGLDLKSILQFVDDPNRYPPYKDPEASPPPSWFDPNAQVSLHVYSLSDKFKKFVKNIFEKLFSWV